MKMKLISRNGEFVAVNLENLNLFRVDEQEANILSLYDKGSTIPDIAAALQISEEKCKKTIDIFCTLPKGVQLVPEELGNLNELVLMVAQDCNLKCDYCYGDGGTYGRERTLMDSKTAFNAIQCASALGDIGRVTFFGGEPLLNFKVIKEVVENTEGVLFGIVTNGTIMTDEMLACIKENNKVVP